MEKIYYGGKILTMEDANIYSEAILVKKGIVTKVGNFDEVKKAASKKTELVDLKGKCLMPAFIDPHSHIVLNGQMAMFADLSQCKSFSDIITVVRQYIEENKISEKQMAVGFGYDNNFLSEELHPTKDVLDKISDRIPILLLHVSGHIGCANSAMLKLAEINEDSMDPKGGRICRIEGTTIPNGVLEESAMMNVQAFMRKRIKLNLNKMFSGLQQKYIECGITTAQEGAANIGNMKLLKIAQLLGKLQIDVVAYPLISDETVEQCLKDKKMCEGYNKHIRIGGYKMLLDGSPQGRTAWMSEPYLGAEEDYCGYPWLTDEKAYEYCLKAMDENMQILAHCNGDAASEQFLTAYEKALKDSNNPNSNNLRPVMIHCQTVRNDQLDRMGKINMIPSIFVGHVYYWGDIHVKNFGETRGHHISPVGDALNRNLTVNFHQDTPITKPDVLHSVWCAVNRISRKGNLIGADQKISVYDALKAVTINAAYAYFEEDTKGSIKEGKRADLVVLDKCPMEVDPMEIKDINVLETIKDGKTIYKRK